MPYNNIAMHKRANEQKTLIQNCSLLHPLNTVVSYMIHACFQATGELTIQYLTRKKQSNIFFDTAPDCRNERVNDFVKNYYDSLDIFGRIRIVLNKSIIVKIDIMLLEVL